jgi:hypothetical protein
MIADGKSLEADLDDFNMLWADLLTGIAYEDDSQIIVLHHAKASDKQKPRP